MQPYAVHDEVASVLEQALDPDSDTNTLIYLNRQQGATTCIQQLLSRHHNEDLHIGIMSPNMYHSNTLVDDTPLPVNPKIRIAVIDRFGPIEKYDLVIASDVGYCKKDAVRRLVAKKFVAFSAATPPSGAERLGPDVSVLDLQWHGADGVVRDDRVPPWVDLDERNRLAGMFARPAQDLAE